ncbi:alanine racemase [Paenibacillus sp. CAA11]|uniref:alanine racemase n=1 Tax=Paenibacillus sp. CAA11 TaxID=1532905 RepID=UPI000D3A5FA3|nr:alanine racemase [Paenibacillus sp. CAA11]AWB43818.1 alanine racemase [Paenibacillus sp. CAA11]
MQEKYRPTRVEIDLDALEANYKALRAALPEGMKLLACVKANAYGHGAVQVSREMERLGADYLSVAFLEEALELRQAGIKLPILVLGYTPPEGVQVAWEQDITLCLFTDEVLEAAQTIERGSSNKRLKVHIKIDTGMGRLGLLPGENAAEFIVRASKLSTVEVEGMFTHYATADEQEKSYTLEQYGRFQSVAEALRERNITIPIIHTGNSATAIDLPGISCDMVRIGIAMYGLYPSEEVHRQNVKLIPVLTLKTQMVYVKKLPPRWGISYGKKYETDRDEVIATLPIGYADGYSRMLGGKAQVLIRGRRVPVVGTICMDQCMVSLQSFAEEAEQIQAGEEVVLIGQQLGDFIAAAELASWLGTIHYEVICMLAHRIPRVYIRAGEPDLWVNPLLK